MLNPEIIDHQPLKRKYAKKVQTNCRNSSYNIAAVKFVQYCRLSYRERVNLISRRHSSLPAPSRPRIKIRYSLSVLQSLPSIEENQFPEWSQNISQSNENGLLPTHFLTSSFLSSKRTQQNHNVATSANKQDLEVNGLSLLSLQAK